MKFGIAAYHNGVFVGMVASAAELPTLPDAAKVAARWEERYPQYSFRGVELDAKGYVVRTDTRFNPQGA